jgi:N-alpha-acetyltransferase 60
VKVLCGLWFPIDYPDTWYQEITSNPRFYSLAATLQVPVPLLYIKSYRCWNQSKAPENHQFKKISHIPVPIR